MKTIVIVTEASNACVYGVGTYISQLKRALENTCDIRIVVASIDHGAQNGILYDGYTLTIPKRAYTSPAKEQAFQQGVARLFACFFEDGTIFQFNMHNHLYLMRMLTRYLPKSPKLYVIHYQNWAFQSKGLIEGLQRAISRTKEQNRSLEEQLLCDAFFEEQDILSEASHIVSLCEYTASVITSVFRVEPQKISVIQNGLSLASDGLRGDIHTMESNELRLLYVGRIHEDKGIIELIRAYKRVRKCYPNSKLFIVGDGDFSCAMREAKDLWGHIVFTGRLNQEEVYSLYQCASVGILPSYTEQCSYTIIEMMMFGLPFVGVRTTGLSEMIVEGENGLSIPLEESENKGYISVQALSDAIVSALRRRHSLNQGFEVFGQRYSLTMMGHQYESLYKSL